MLSAAFATAASSSGEAPSASTPCSFGSGSNINNINAPPLSFAQMAALQQQIVSDISSQSNLSMPSSPSLFNLSCIASQTNCTISDGMSDSPSAHQSQILLLDACLRYYKEQQQAFNTNNHTHKSQQMLSTVSSPFSLFSNTVREHTSNGYIYGAMCRRRHTVVSNHPTILSSPSPIPISPLPAEKTTVDAAHDQQQHMTLLLSALIQQEQAQQRSLHTQLSEKLSPSSMTTRVDNREMIIPVADSSLSAVEAVSAAAIMQNNELEVARRLATNHNLSSLAELSPCAQLPIMMHNQFGEPKSPFIEIASNNHSLHQQQFKSGTNPSPTEQSNHAQEILAAMIAAKTAYEKEMSKWKWCEAASSAAANSQQFPMTSSTSDLLPLSRRKMAMTNHHMAVNLNDLQNDITSDHYHHHSSSFLLPQPMNMGREANLSAEKLDNSVNCCQVPSTSEQQQYSATIPYNYQKKQSMADQCQLYPHMSKLVITTDDQQRQRSKSLQSDFRRNSQQQQLPTIINYLRTPAQTSTIESFLKYQPHNSSKQSPLIEGDHLLLAIQKSNQTTAGIRSNLNAFLQDREKHFSLRISDQRNPPNKAPVITLTDSPPPPSLSANNLIPPFNCHQIPTPNNRLMEKGYKRPLSTTTVESRNTSSVENVFDAGPVLWNAKNGAVDYGDDKEDEELTKMPRLLPECIMTFDTDDAENLAPPPQLDAFDDDVSGADDEDEYLLRVNEESRTCTAVSRKNEYITTVVNGAPLFSGDVSDGGLPPLLSAPPTPLSVIIDDVQNDTTGLKNSPSVDDTESITCQKDRFLAQRQQQLPSPSDNDVEVAAAISVEPSSAPRTECDYVKERRVIPPPTSVLNRYSNVSASSDDCGVDICGYYSVISTRLPTVGEDLLPSSGVPMEISSSTAVVPVSTPLTLSVSSLSGGLTLGGIFSSVIPFPTPPPTSSSASSADSIGSLSDFCGSVDKVDNSLMLTPIENRRHTFPTVNGNNSLTSPNKTFSKWNSVEFTSLDNVETPKCAEPLSTFGDAAQKRRMKYASRKRHFEPSSAEEDKASVPSMALIAKDSSKKTSKSDLYDKGHCVVVSNVYSEDQRRVPPMKIVLTQREDYGLSNGEDNFVKRKSKSPNLLMESKSEKTKKFFPIFKSKRRSATVSSPCAKHVKKVASGDISEAPIMSNDYVKGGRVQKCKNFEESAASKRDVITQRESEETDDEYDSILTISRRTKSFTTNGTSSIGQCTTSEEPLTSKHLLLPKSNPSELISFRKQSHRNKRSSFRCRRKRRHHSGAEHSAAVDGRRHSTPASSMVKGRKGAAQKTSKRGSLPVQNLTTAVAKKSSKASHEDRSSILRFVVPPERKSSRCAAMLLEKSSLTKESNLSLSKSSLESESNFGSLAFPPSKRRHTTSAGSVISRSPIAHLKFVSNWRPIGDGMVKSIRFINDSLPVKRRCFSAIRHWAEHDEVIRVRDCVKICSAEGFENIGKVMYLHYDEASKAIMATVLWFYTQVQVDTSKGLRVDEMHEKELLASRHIDTVNADCIESLAFVLTFNEYCRFVAETRIDQLPPFRRADECSELWSRGEHSYPRRLMLPHEDTPIELVYFCRRIYSLKTKKICLSLPTLLQNTSSGGASLSNGLLTADNSNSVSGCHRKSNAAKEAVSEVKCAKERGKRSLSKFY